MVGLRHRLSVKPAPTNVCRGGFYEEYLIPANNLYKPAPTQQITYVNLYFARNETAICYKLAGSGDNSDSPISVDSESADNSVSATVISSLNPNASSSATKQ